MVEIPDGSMETFKDLLQNSEVNFVLFYAPWCGRSRNAAQEFNRAANILYREVRVCYDLIYVSVFVIIHVSTLLCYQAYYMNMCQLFNNPVMFMSHLHCTHGLFMHENYVGVASLQLCVI